MRYIGYRPMIWSTGKALVTFLHSCAAPSPPDLTRLLSKTLSDTAISTCLSLPQAVQREVVHFPSHAWAKPDGHWYHIMFLYMGVQVLPPLCAPVFPQFTQPHFSVGAASPKTPTILTHCWKTAVMLLRIGDLIQQGPQTTTAPTWDAFLLTSSHPDHSCSRAPHILGPSQLEGEKQKV